MTLRHTRRAQRGSTLLMVMVALVALLIIGLAAVEFTGRDAGNARQSQRKSAVERCALAAKSWVVATGSTQDLLPGTTLVVNLAGSGGEDSVSIVAGQHYDGAIGTYPTVMKPTMGGSMKRSKGNETNQLAAGFPGNSSVYPSVLCKDTDGRQYEMEVAFGVNL